MSDYNLSADPESTSETRFPWQDFLYHYRFQAALALIGIILICVGIVFTNKKSTSSSNIEILESTTQSDSGNSDVVVEVSGAVKKPGVYKLPSDARIEDALAKADGLSENADTLWIEKYLNRASKITDGQKIYIPVTNEQSDVLSANSDGGNQTVSGGGGSGIAKTININTASQSELESLWGIGPVYAQNIIEHRPYSNPEELIRNGIIKQNVWDRNKDLFTVY